MESHSAFFYGTLMVPQILYRVIYGSEKPHHLQASALTIRPARLHHYIRHRVAGCDYPAILESPEPTACVFGSYVQGLTAADMWRLDRFEGDEYARRHVPLRILDERDEEAEQVVAETYLWIAPKEMLEPSEWDLEEFRREKMHNWIGGSKEYNEVDEAVEAASSERNSTGGRFVNGSIAPAFGAE